jgi:anti-sigma regulatory factor (Ser/Thr protein kinase)
MVGPGASQRPQSGNGPAASSPATPRDCRGTAYPTGILDALGDPAVHEVCLTSRPESAAIARRLVLARLRAWTLTAVADTCELLVSELVGNAVRHTGAQTFGLRVTRRRGWIRVEVRDPSRALPCLLPVREMDLSGRGLMLVDKLSDRWGVDLLARGKTAWFELRVPDR